ncbi:glycosyltransferase 87 family protein [Streptomyces sp. NPDC093085]|uniref:glycosyltransferase 87 family protein n=1 Tax=Streptomyces sp. NPDC093085 TaxID=3155068 RepID=UPI003445DEF5
MTSRTVTFRSLLAVGALVLSLAAFAALGVTRPVHLPEPLAGTAPYDLAPYGMPAYGTTTPHTHTPAAPAPENSSPHASLYSYTSLYSYSSPYPPFAAILLVPTVWLPAGALKVVLLLGNLALLALLVRLSARLAGRPASALVVMGAVAAGLWLEPVSRTILLGEITLALACLVLWDLARPDHALGKGFALGVAAGVTLTPALFIAYLLLTSRVRQGLTALAALAATVLLGALVLPYASGEFWTARILAADRTGAVWGVADQSLHGLLARLCPTDRPGLRWAAVALVTGAAGLWAARRAAVRAGSETWGVLLTAVTALLVTPVSWSHEWVWCVPLLAALLAEGRVRTAVLAGAVWTARGFWAVPYEADPAPRPPWWHQPLISPYTLCALALLTLTTWHTRTPRPTGPPYRLPGPRGDRKATAGAGKDRRVVAHADHPERR